MSSFHRILLVCLAGTITAAGCAAQPAPAPGAALRIHPLWEAHMSAGLDASEVGDLREAARHYRRAVEVARRERIPAEELAFSAYRLGDLIRRRADLSRGESALALLEEARRSFESAYGADHPVLLPVWARIATIHDSAGDHEAGDAARRNADRIAVRFFPENHFLRERFGAARPASVVHPLEVLALLGEDGADEDEQIVGAPN